MKHTIILISIVLGLFTNIVFAQNDSSAISDKEQVSETIQKWNKAMLNGDVDVINDYYPSNRKTFYVGYQKIQEMDADWMLKSLGGQFETMKYKNYDMLPNPFIYVTEDEQAAFVYATTEMEYEILNTNKGERFSVIGLEFFIKENGKWVSVLRTTEEVKEKRKSVVLDKSILNEYNGTYKSERTGNIFTIENDGKNLISKLGDEESVYIPQSEYSFYKDRFVQSLVFGRDKNGKVSFYTYIKDNTCTQMNKIDTTEL